MDYKLLQKINFILDSIHLTNSFRILNTKIISDLNIYFFNIIKNICEFLAIYYIQINLLKIILILYGLKSDFDNSV